MPFSDGAGAVSYTHLHPSPCLRTWQLQNVPRAEAVAGESRARTLRITLPSVSYTHLEKNFWGENEENFEKIAKVLELAGDLVGFKDYILNNDLINIVVPGGSLLNYAITEGKEKEALWLIENGIDINAFDGLELMTAIKKNNNIIAKKLIDEGIVINSRAVSYTHLDVYKRQLLLIQLSMELLNVYLKYQIMYRQTNFSNMLC